MKWAAMMFLLAANRMSRGYARLRQWLILALRMLAIAALLFAVSRPLAGGWLGLTGGGRADTTIVLLDRSPSMQQNGESGGGSKLDSGRRQLARTFQTLGSARWLLLESGTNTPRSFDSPDALLTMTSAEPVSASSDIPGMLLAARDVIRENKSGRTEVWICSDIRENDWNVESGRWTALREGFQELPQTVRFHLLAYPREAPANLSIRVTETRYRSTRDGGELLVSLRIRRDGGGDERQTIPVQIEIEGARSEVSVELAGPVAELKDYRITLGKGHDHGWGRVAIPADANPADNDFWFAFEPPVPRRTVIVAEDSQAALPLQLAASIANDPSISCVTENVAVDALNSVDWDEVALLIWQAPLPKDGTAKLVRSFVDRGGRVLFLPTRETDSSEFLGTKWTSWNEHPDAVSVASWRGDEDLLARTQSGSALPVGEVRIMRSRGLTGEFTPLATLPGGAPLLARVVTNRGGVYFLATTPAVGDSSLATGGVVLYVLVQRALDAGAATLGNARPEPKRPCRPNSPCIAASIGREIGCSP
jgi:hypothetical protein